jgi:16S rRNA (guanine1516-N2)-methyltransferase
VVEDTPSHRRQALSLSAKLGIPDVRQNLRQTDASLVSAFDNQAPAPLPPYSILVTRKGLMLKDNQSNQRPLFIDFSTKSSYSRRLKAGGVNQLLAKAIGIRQGLRPDVLDCTAGLARDAYFLAAMGCRVTMLERSRILAALIEDALARLGEFKAAASDLVNAQHMENRLTLESVDAKDYLRKPGLKSAVVYIDTMFPERKKTALVKGEMQLLQNFLQHEDDAETLVKIALDAGYKKVVVKRPAQGKWQQPLRVHHAITGKSVRFDVFTGN